jgi:hypothetical protein
VRDHAAVRGPEPVRPDVHWRNQLSTPSAGELTSAHPTAVSLGSRAATSSSSQPRLKCERR